MSKQPRKWTPEMDGSLTAQWRAGVALKVISHSLGRAPKTITARRHVLGLENRKAPNGQVGKYAEVPVWIPQSELSALDQRVQASGASRSAFIRGLIRTELEGVAK